MDVFNGCCEIKNMMIRCLRVGGSEARSFTSFVYIFKKLFFPVSLSVSNRLLRLSRILRRFNVYLSILSTVNRSS